MAVLAISCLLLGLFHVPIVDWMLGKDLSYFKSVSWSYLAEYFLFVGLGVLVYQFVLSKKYKFVERIRTFTISFETANVLFLSFFAVMIVFFVLWI